MLPVKKAAHATKRPDIETLDALYAEKSAREIAVMYGVAEPTVRSWIARYRRDQRQQGPAAKK